MITSCGSNANVEQRKENIQLLKRTVIVLNIIREGSNHAITELVKKIRQQIEEVTEKTQCELDKVKLEITKQPNNQYNIKFLEIKDCSDVTLNSLQGLQLIAKKKDGEYKFGVEFGEGAEKFYLGGMNEKLPYQSQVSVLEGLENHLALIATATGSGKTITKLMLALGANLFGMKVVSVNPRDDLVSQEYEDQKGAVLYNSITHISRNNQYDDSKTHNILSLNRFFAASNEVVSLDKLSKLIRDNNAENEGFTVDLKKKKIIIGKNIEIYQDRYKVNGTEVKESIFNNKNLLLIFDEIQDMINQGEAYYVEIQLLLLLASWKKINLAIVTATPPVWVKEFIEKEGGYIKAQSLKEKINSGVGGRVDIVVRKNSKDEQFVQDYVKNINTKILERSEGEIYYYDHTKSLRQAIMLNLQSPRNRMTLVCSDSNVSAKLLKDTILSPEEQLATLKSKKDKDKDSDKKCDFYQSTNLGNGESIKSRLIGMFGNDKETKMNKILEEFDFTSSIAESGVFAVAHGFIDNVISCVTGVPFDELSKKRFSDFESFKKKFIETLTKIRDDEINNKISEYITSVLKIEDTDKANRIHQGMKIVGDLFVKYKDDDEQLTILLSNHNLSRKIHKMIPPDFSKLSDDNIVEIFAGGHSYGFFKYLENNYDVSNLRTIGNGFSTLYKEYKDKDGVAKDYKRNTVDPAQRRFDNILLAEEQLNALRDKYNTYFQEHERLQEEARRKKENLIQKFKEEKAIKFLQDKEKYPLSELRAICNEFAIIEKDTKDGCLEDKLSQAGLVGYYFNNHRKSGFNNTKLHNVVMRETVKDDLESKKQCVGRTGRKNGPIISLSYVDSSKIGNLDWVHNQLENGGPFEFAKATKNKINPQEFAKKMTDQIEGIVNEYCNCGEDTVAEEVIKCIFATYHELYNHTEYNNNETYKAFTQILKNVTSTLGVKCKEKNIVVGDSTVKFNIRGIESKIGKIVDELVRFSQELDSKKENKDKINAKLKIEGNFLKRFIVKLCTLVLHLWHWRLSPTQEQISEILEKDDPSTIKERVILRKVQMQVANEVKLLVKKEKKLESEKSDLTKEKTKLYGEYNKMHKCVGVIKGKGGVKQKEITKSEMDSIIEKQLSGIKRELDNTKKSLSESNKKYGKDLKAFKALKGKIDHIEFDINKVKDILEEFIKTQDKLSQFSQKISKLIGDLKRGNSLNWTIVKIDREREEYGNFFDDQKGKKIKVKIDQERDALQGEYKKGIPDKEEISKKVEKLAGTLEEMIEYINTKKVPQAKDFEELKKEGVWRNTENHENQTQIEKLCDLVRDGIADLFNKEVQETYADVERLLSYSNKFTKEKESLEEIQGEQEDLAKKINELNKEHQKLKDFDADQQMNMCGKLLIYKSINKNYNLRCCMWLLLVLYKWTTESPEDHNDYVSSPVFLELFTNIIMPLMNDGTLKMALDVIESSGNNSEEKVGKLDEFYKNLVNRNFDTIGKSDVANAWKCMREVALLIASTKFNHYLSGFNKDVNLINNFTFGKIDLLGLASTKLQDDSSSSIGDPFSLLRDGLVTSLKRKSVMQLLQQSNPITQGIYADDVNSGVSIVSTLHCIIQAFSFTNKHTLLSDTSIEKARKAIERLGGRKDRDDTMKDIYENLVMFLEEWKECNKQITWNDESPTEEEKFAKRFQTFAQAARSASTQECLPAVFFTNPSVHRLDLVQAVAV